MPTLKTKSAKPRRKPGLVAARLKIDGDPGVGLDRLLGKKQATKRGELIVRAVALLVTVLVVAGCESNEFCEDVRQHNSWDRGGAGRTRLIYAYDQDNPFAD